MFVTKSKGKIKLPQPRPIANKHSRLIGLKFDKSTGETIEHDEEVVLVIWRHKNLMTPGHAAMKLKRIDEDDEKVKRFDYISWWPSGGAADAEKATRVENKGGVKSAVLPNFQARHGAKHDNYWIDQHAEMSEETKVAIYASYFYRAFCTNDPGHAKFGLKKIWKNAESFHPTFKEMGFTEYFANMDTMVKNSKIGLRSNHKVKKGSAYAKGREFDLDKVKSNIKSWTEVLSVGKLPDVKIYLPCAYIRRIETEDETKFLPVWGLSLDSIQFSWTLFQGRPNQHWQMITNQINCASVVWNRLMDGFADVILKGKTQSLATKIRSKLFLQPNDITTLGDKLHDAFSKLNNMQGFIEREALKRYAQIKVLDEANKKKMKSLPGSDKIKRQVKSLAEPPKSPSITETGGLEMVFLDTGHWRLMLTYNHWRMISKTKKPRSSQLRSIDSLVRQYERARDEITPEEEIQLINSLSTSRKMIEGLKSLLEKVKNKQPTAFREKSLTDKMNFARKMMEINFETVIKAKQERLNVLIKLLEAIHKYVNKRNPLDDRLPSVLFLGKCVGWGAYETIRFKHVLLIRPISQDFYVNDMDKSIDLEDDDTPAIIVPPSCTVISAL